MVVCGGGDEGFLWCVVGGKGLDCGGVEVEGWW